MVQKEDIITIDGPSGVGKSTLAKALATRLGYGYLDTGALYRAVTLAAIKNGLRLNPPDEKEIACLLDRIDLALDEKGRVLLDGERLELVLREDRVNTRVSLVSAVGRVRSYLVKLQRDFAARGPLVAEGRDLGSVVFPEARVKFYLEADPSERARRRARQNIQGSLDMEESEAEEHVLKDQERRDRLDAERTLSPLRLSKDMIKIDTTDLSVDEVLEKMLEFI
jgi:cytidylate kinase